MGQTYGYDYDKVINLIKNNTSVQAVSEVIEKFGMGVVEMSRNFQGAVAGVGIDKIYNDMREDLLRAYASLQNMDEVLDIVLKEAETNKRIAEEPDPTPVVSTYGSSEPYVNKTTPVVSTYGSSAPYVSNPAPTYRPSHYGSNTSR